LSFNNWWISTNLDLRLFILRWDTMNLLIWFLRTDLISSKTDVSVSLLLTELSPLYGIDWSSKNESENWNVRHVLHNYGSSLLLSRWYSLGVISAHLMCHQVEAWFTQNCSVVFCHCSVTYLVPTRIF
jgi:hypothetical protein